jgi:hypothetical protein
VSSGQPTTWPLCRTTSVITQCSSISTAIPAQQQSVSTLVTSALCKPTIKTATTARAKTTAGGRKKSSQGRGSSKKQAVIDDEIDLQHILRHWNYCHKKFRKVSFSSWEDSELYELGDFVPLAESGRAGTAVGLSPPQPDLLEWRDGEMGLTNSPEEATTMTTAMAALTSDGTSIESRDEGASNG